MSKTNQTTNLPGGAPIDSEPTCPECGEPADVPTARCQDCIDSDTLHSAAREFVGHWGWNHNLWPSENEAKGWVTTLLREWNDGALSHYVTHTGWAKEWLPRVRVAARNRIDSEWNLLDADEREDASVCLACWGYGTPTEVFVEAEVDTVRAPGVGHTSSDFGSGKAA